MNAFLRITAVLLVIGFVFVYYVIKLIIILRLGCGLHHFENKFVEHHGEKEN
jgi:hypothetical protein